MQAGGGDVRHGRSAVSVFFSPDRVVPGLHEDLGDLHVLLGHALVLDPPQAGQVPDPVAAGPGQQGEDHGHVAWPLGRHDPQEVPQHMIVRTGVLRDQFLEDLEFGLAAFENANSPDLPGSAEEAELTEARGDEPSLREQGPGP